MDEVEREIIYEPIENCNDENCMCCNYKPLSDEDYNHSYILFENSLHEISLETYKELSSWQSTNGEHIDIKTLDGKTFAIFTHKSFVLTRASHPTKFEDMEEFLLPSKIWGNNAV